MCVCKRVCVCVSHWHLLCLQGPVSNWAGKKNQFSQQRPWYIHYLENKNHIHSWILNDEEVSDGATILMYKTAEAKALWHSITMVLAEHEQHEI